MVLTEKVRRALIACADPGYSAFTLKLTPGLDPARVLGVRSPDLRRICKELSFDERKEYLKLLPHEYHDENNLHSIVISGIKDEQECIEAISGFLPYIDNWATCDTVSPAVFKKHKTRLLPQALGWLESGETYTVRMGVGMLMKYFLDGDFDPAYNRAVAGIISDEYYINMMCAWYFATALAKRYDDTAPYLSEGRLSPAVHRMTVKKALESFRITDDQKKWLKELK